MISIDLLLNEWIYITILIRLTQKISIRIRCVARFCITRVGSIGCIISSVVIQSKKIIWPFYHHGLLLRELRQSASNKRSHAMRIVSISQWIHEPTTNIKDSYICTVHGSWWHDSHSFWPMWSPLKKWASVCTFAPYGTVLGCIIAKSTGGKCYGDALPPWCYYGRSCDWCSTHHPNMKSRARFAAFWWWVAFENGTNQCDTNVIPIFPFWYACMQLFHNELIISV